MVNFMKITNVLSVTLLVACCLQCLSVQHIMAQPDQAALTVVSQEENTENGDVTVEVTGEENENFADKQVQVEQFIPTDEWKPIKPGQTVPAGLHIRLNLETGVKEAKLNNDGNKDTKYWKTGDGHDTIQMDKKKLSRDELKKALKDFKTSQIDDFDQKKADKVKSQYKSYKELKEDFKKMNMDIQTDGEVVTSLVQSLKDRIDDPDKTLSILIELEYYLHQIDNAVLFKDLGGLPVLIKLLNASTNIEIQKTVSLVLGAALQSNPKVQIGALEAGGMQILLRIMATNQSVDLRKKLMFAISALIRHFPYAQKRFLELGGLSTLAELFHGSGTEAVCVKAVVLLNDLLLEREHTEQHTDQRDAQAVEKLKQYKQVHLREAMYEQGWCDLIASLLELPDHDNREKILSAMRMLNTECNSQFKKVHTKLEKLRKEYLVLAEEEKDDLDKYFTLILESVDHLLKQLHSKEEL